MKNLKKDTQGSFFCSCPAGFRRAENSFNKCEDIDECYEEIGTCYEPDLWKKSRKEIRDDLNLFSSRCVNTVGSFYCECLQNYREVDKKCIPKPASLILPRQPEPGKARPYFFPIFFKICLIWNMLDLRIKSMFSISIRPNKECLLKSMFVK